MTEWIAIDHTILPSAWPFIEEKISKACQKTEGRFEPQDIYQFAKNRDVQIWTAVTDKQIDAVCVTEIIKYPRKKYARVMILIGEHKDRWQSLYQENIEAWAKAQDCDGVESLARKGWQKEFKDYKFTHIFLEKEF